MEHGILSGCACVLRVRQSNPIRPFIQPMTKGRPAISMPATM
ncbi:hypothetical protein [Azospirillum largimobile]